LTYNYYFAYFVTSPFLTDHLNPVYIGKKVVHRIRRSRYCNGVIVIYDYEEDIFYHLAHYRSNPQMAKQMRCTKDEIKNAILILFEKTGVPLIDDERHCRHSLVDWALEHGVLFKENGEWIRGSERK
jgi:hypothetical protein